MLLTVEVIFNTKGRLACDVNHVRRTINITAGQGIKRGHKELKSFIKNWSIALYISKVLIIILSYGHWTSAIVVNT